MLLNNVSKMGNLQSFVNMSSKDGTEKMVKPLKGQIAIVTGASRGVGKGIAVQLGEAGATVYVTGREPSKSFSFKEKDLPSLTQTAQDHNDVKKLFDRVAAEQNQKLDVLVNAAYSGTPNLMEEGGKKFYECDPLLWDDMNNVGLRNVYICSVHAARLMVPHKSGLIVNISSAGGLQYFFNVAYGVGKAAVLFLKLIFPFLFLLSYEIFFASENHMNFIAIMELQIDRMGADMAFELKPHHVSVISLWPGTVKTEMSEKLISSGKFSEITGLSQDFAERSLENGETPEFAGRAVVGLASDSNVLKKSGRIQLTGDLSREYGFVDIDGRSPANMRSVNAALDFFGWSNTAKLVPSCFKVPSWALHLSSYKF
ncbi:unnamed protein product [Anisakis simplex]|uniref:Dehydrogenase/reductase SDR family member 1 (inferred by orthology to a human protein) n=1 Tax=Anisakis simplex TaxID=6269 RepID=A0A0M3K7C5_ANISI|nr:unnamed protein product [Anisakis simplex]